MGTNCYTYQGEHYTCQHCGWDGPGTALRVGDVFDALYEMNCPACDEKVLNIMYPTLEEMRANWDNLSKEQRVELELYEQLRAQRDRQCLKTPE